MEKDKSFQYIKEESPNISVPPRPEAWEKLNQRLAGETAKKNLSGQKWLMGIAAAIMIMIAGFLVFQVQIDHLVEPQNSTIVEWESLDENQEYFYSRDQIKTLYAAYMK